MFGSSEDGKRSSILLTTLKSVAVIGALSYLAAGWMSASSDRDAMARLALAASRGVADPLTTGAIGTRAQSTRIDPCASPRR